MDVLIADRSNGASTVGWALATAGLVAVGLGLPANAEPPVSSTRPTSAPAWAEALDANVELAAGVYTVQELIRRISAQTGAPYVIGPDIEKLHLDQSLRVPKFAGCGYRAVLLVATLAGLDLYWTDDLVIFLPEGALPQVLRIQRDAALREHLRDLGLDADTVLTRRAPLDLMDATLSAAADGFIREYGLPVVILPGVREMQSLASIEGTDLSLGDALNQFEKSTGLSASVRWGMVWWSVESAEPAEAPTSVAASASREVELQEATTTSVRALLSEASDWSSDHDPLAAPERGERRVDARGSVAEISEALELVRRTRR
jgi:hypothetical protein